MTGPIPASALPIAAVARAVQDRQDKRGLSWHLRPATVAAYGADGQLRIVYDDDSTPVNAVSIIGRLPVGGRVMGMITPPAGNHVVGFLGADAPANNTGEAIGRSWLVELTSDFSTGANNTTPIAVTGMSFTAAPLGRYVVRLRASSNGDTAADIKFGWTAPSGAQMERYVLAIPVAETTNANPGTWTSARRIVSDNQGAANTSSVAPSTALPGYWEDILVRIGATGGTVQLMTAQVAVSATPSLVRAQSYMEIQRYR